MRKLLISMGLLLTLMSCSTEKYEKTPKRWSGHDTLKIMWEDENTPIYPPDTIHKYNGVKFKHPKFTSAKIEKYVLKFYKTAQEEHQLFNIPASITLAQGILESGCGLSKLSKRDNAHFGIKPGNWVGTKKLYTTNEWDSKQKKFVEVKAYFRTYPSAWWSYRNRSHFLTKTKRYEPCFNCGDDYKCWAQQLKKCGYATDPNYTQSLINIIKQNKLYVYDGIRFI